MGFSAPMLQFIVIFTSHSSVYTSWDVYSILLSFVTSLWARWQQSCVTTCLYSSFTAVPIRHQHSLKLTVICWLLMPFLNHVVCMPIMEEYLSCIHLHCLAILLISKNSSCFQNQGETFHKDPECELLFCDLSICTTKQYTTYNTMLTVLTMWATYATINNLLYLQYNTYCT